MATKTVVRVVPSSKTTEGGTFSIAPSLRRTIGDPPEQRRIGRRPKRREIIKVRYRPKAQEVARGSKKVPLSIHQQRKAEARRPYGGRSLAGIAKATLAKLPGLGGEP